MMERRAARGIGGKTGMLWEIILEMLGELFAAAGEILLAFWGLMKWAFGNKKDATEEEKKRHKKVVLNTSIVLLTIGTAFMFPQVRHFVFGGGANEWAHRGEAREEKPRNDLPMAQYTLPGLYTKKKVLIEDDDGIKRIVYYYWYAPRVPKGQKLPLVVVLHGRDGLSQPAIYLRASAIQKMFPSILLIPQSPAGKIWAAPAKYSGEETLKLDAASGPVPEAATSLRDAIYLMAKATLESPVDENRMYIVGCDDGGTGVFGALAQQPGLFAAGLAVGGKWSFLDREKLAKTPLLILSGSLDKLIPPTFGGTMAELIKAVGGRAAYHEFPGIAHDCDAPVFYSTGVWQWLFSQVRAPRVGVERELEPQAEHGEQPVH